MSTRDAARRRIGAVLLSLTALALVVRFGLPALLHGLGLHPEPEPRAFDLGYSDELGAGIAAASAAGKVVGGVCHGPLGLLRARTPDGRPLVEGRRLTAVTDKQVRELGIDVTPQHPETELRRAGARFESRSAFRDVFASHVVVDGNLVTGQNQNSGAETAHRMMELLAAPTSRAS